MKQLETLKKLKQLFVDYIGLDAAILYGSFARSKGGPRSDLDIKLLVNNRFDLATFDAYLKIWFGESIKFTLVVKVKKKLVVYFQNQPKLEFGICTNVAEIARDYQGSAISDVKETILYKSPDYLIDLEVELLQLVNKSKVTQESIIQEVQTLVEKFVYEFESCSTMHARSDAYQFYFFYNCALQVAIQLKLYAKQQYDFIFLPKNFVVETLEMKEREVFNQLSATLDLRLANAKKRSLLDFFYQTIENLLEVEIFLNTKRLCEWFYDRDYLWNFRDLSTYNEKIRPGLFYRSSSLSLIQSVSNVPEIFSKYDINTLIDLRSDIEIQTSEYSSFIREVLNYVNVPINTEDAKGLEFPESLSSNDYSRLYYYFVNNLQSQIVTAFRAILSATGGAVLIHCIAGKDRTGFIITLLHLLSGASVDEIYNDYLASAQDVKAHYLKIILDNIEQQGGIKPYLKACGLEESEINLLKAKILKP